MQWTEESPLKTKPDFSVDLLSLPNISIYLVDDLEVD